MQLEKKMPSPPWAPVMEERGMVTLYHLNDATSLKVILFFGDDLLLAKHNPNVGETKHWMSSEIFRTSSEIFGCCTVNLSMEEKNNNVLTDP